MSTIEREDLLPVGKVELLNKEDEEGHHYLKILLLSNKLNGNKWQLPYQDIKQLPQQLLDSYKDLDGYPQHDNTHFLKLYNDLKKEGKSEDHIFLRFRDESNKKSLGKVTQVFTEYTPSRELLFGEFKVTNKEWNKFIKENKRTPFGFTSPALLGKYDITEEGNMIYHPDTARAFHIGFVPVPAFPPEEAKIRAICHSEDQACRTGIAFASAEPTPLAAEPDKNLNTDTNNNTNIHMSNENNPPTQVTAELRTDTAVPVVKLEEKGYDKNSDITTKLNTELRQSGDPQKKSEREEEESIEKTNKINKELATAEERLAKLESDLKIARKEKEEQRNFILDKILLANIPRENFKKDDEYDAEKNNVKEMINKYNMSYDDSEWFVKKAYPKAPVTEGNKKGSNPLTAGLNNNIFAPSSLTTTSTEQPKQETKSYCPSNPLPIEF